MEKLDRVKQIIKEAQKKGQIKGPKHLQILSRRLKKMDDERLQRLLESLEASDPKK